MQQAGEQIGDGGVQGDGGLPGDSVFRSGQRRYSAGLEFVGLTTA